MSIPPHAHKHRRFAVPTIQEVLALREENHLKSMVELLRLRGDSLLRVSPLPRRGVSHG